MNTINVDCDWDFTEILCDECDADASPNEGGGIVEWNDPRREHAILCETCMDLYREDIHSVILHWRRSE